MSEPPAIEPEGPAPRPIPALDFAALEALRADLVGYARFLIAQRPFLSPMGRRLAEDVAADAIVVAVENLAGYPSRRTWAPARCSLRTFCRGVVKSRISAARQHGDEQDGVDIGGELENLIAFDPSPDPLSRTLLNNLYDRLVVSLVNDPVARLVLELMVRDAEATIVEQAAALRLSETDIKNARQRIFRHGHQIASDADDPH